MADLWHNGRVELLQHRPYGPQRLKYLLSGPWQRKFVDSAVWSSITTFSKINRHFSFLIILDLHSICHSMPCFEILLLLLKPVICRTSKAQDTQSQTHCPGWPTIFSIPHYSSLHQYLRLWQDRNFITWESQDQGWMPPVRPWCPYLEYENNDHLGDMW